MDGFLELLISDMLELGLMMSCCSGPGESLPSKRDLRNIVLLVCLGLLRLALIFLMILGLVSRLSDSLGVLRPVTRPVGNEADRLVLRRKEAESMESLMQSEAADESLFLEDCGVFSVRLYLTGWDKRFQMLPFLLLESGVFVSLLLDCAFLSSLLLLP